MENLILPFHFIHVLGLLSSVNHVILWVISIMMGVISIVSIKK